MHCICTHTHTHTHTHAPLVGSEPQVGCRLGVAGSFSTLDGDALAAMIGDATNHSSSPQQRVASDHVATSCYGREISRFSIGLGTGTLAVAQGVGDGRATGDATPDCVRAEAGAPAASGGTKSEAGSMSDSRSRDKPVFAADAACFCVTELLNQTDQPLLYERAVFFGGAMHNAPPLRLAAGRRTYWTSGQGSGGMDIMRGNLSAVIFTVGHPKLQTEPPVSVGGGKAELLLVTHLSRLQMNPQCIGVRIGAVGSFTAMDEKKLRSLVVESTASLTTTWQRVTDRASGLEALASVRPASTCSPATHSAIQI
eukprot:COSAG03_NODE_1332_length_4310_cov_9.453099_2_plen_311_part_00